VDLVKKVGINNTDESEIVCTSWILAKYLESIKFKDTCYVIGSSGIEHELNNVKISHIGIGNTVDLINDPAKCDYQQVIKLDPRVKCVVVGFDYYFNYPKLVTATSYAYNNPECLFIATNGDALYPSGQNSSVVIPGTGTIVNAVQTGIGRKPVMMGKPNKIMWEVLEKVHNLDKSRSCMIGDRLDTDIAFAANCSLGYSLAVMTGVTNEQEIMKVSKALKDQNSNSDEAKCVPDFYTESLGSFNNFIQDIQDI
jgi:phosphoglycolate/pyridoxal phosphate phosphatase family enzyme